MNRIKSKNRKITTFILNAIKTTQVKKLFNEIYKIAKDELYKTSEYKGYGELHDLSDFLKNRRKMFKLFHPHKNEYFHDCIFLFNF